VRLDEGVSCSSIALKLSMERFFGWKDNLDSCGRGRRERERERERKREKKKSV
jgi:hypothetical protein